MLQLSQEILDDEFPELPWKLDQAEELSNCLVFDTYETNKEIIYKIAKGMDPCLLRLNDLENVMSKIKVALDLANCIRPLDSITASYMLKVSLLSPVINQVLDKFQGNVENVPEGTAERATLRLILTMLERLRVKIRNKMVSLEGNENYSPDPAFLKFSKLL